jgi:hypothetical protein
MRMSFVPFPALPHSEVVVVTLDYCDGIGDFLAGENKPIVCPSHTKKHRRELS